MYRRRGGSWVLSEAPAEVAAEGRHIRVGRSRAFWQNGELVLELCERSTPWGAPMRGIIRLQPEGPAFAPQALHPGRPHWWWPVAPCARVDVQMEAPREQWRGRAYHDVNWGHEPLSRAFAGWSWQRLWHAEGTRVEYVTRPREGEPQHISHLYRADGTTEQVAPEALHPLPGTRWGLQRRAVGQAHETRRMEDTPFYSRSRIAVRTGEGVLHGFHEQLDMDRFDAPWVQFLLPFRMRHRA